MIGLYSTPDHRRDHAHLVQMGRRIDAVGLRPRQMSAKCEQFVVLLMFLRLFVVECCEMLWRRVLLLSFQRNTVIPATFKCHQKP